MDELDFILMNSICNQNTHKMHCPSSWTERRHVMGLKDLEESMMVSITITKKEKERQKSQN